MAHWRGGKSKRDKTDILFSELVRERADWTCEYCNVNYRHDPGYLHCSHMFGRRKQSVRWHPDNAFAHCLKCHQNLGEHPVEFAEWARDRLGQAVYDRVRIIANTPSKVDKEWIHKHYLAERKRMKAERAAGHVGRLEFALP